MAEEHEKHEEHKSEGGNTFQKHKTLWIIGGVGAAGVLLLLFMNGNQGGGQQQPTDQTQANSPQMLQGGGGAVDTSSLVGTGGMPSWYNPGTAENMDYWPYVPTGTGSNSSSSGNKKKKSSSGSSSKSSGSSSKSSSGSSNSSNKKKKSSSGSSHKTGGVTHGTTHGVHTTTSAKNKTTSKAVAANPHAGGAHGWVYTAKGGENVQSLFSKAWPGQKPGFGFNYANNAQLLKGMKSTTLKKGQQVVL